MSVSSLRSVDTRVRGKPTVVDFVTATHLPLDLAGLDAHLGMLVTGCKLAWDGFLVQ